MEKVKFNSKLSLEENFELVVRKAEAADPEMGKMFRSYTQFLVAASSDSDRKKVRSLIHHMAKADLDKALSKETE